MYQFQSTDVGVVLFSTYSDSIHEGISGIIVFRLSDWSDF